MNSTTVLDCVSAPSPASRFATLSIFMTALISPLRREIRAGSVPAGANKPFHSQVSKPGRTSEIAGTPGSTSTGLGPVCAMQVTSLEVRSATVPGTLLNSSGIRPANRSFRTEPISLEGTWLILMPAFWFSSSSETCCTVPIPVEAQSSVPGLLFASAINSGIVLAENCALRTRVTGVTIVWAIGRRSRCVS